MKQKSLRILAASVALVLIGLILFITNSFVGNPISQWIAQNAIEEHLSEHYQSLELEVSKPFYNFKFGEYVVHATSLTSEDTNFSITYRGGKVDDNYESSVSEKWNTYLRLEGEYAKIVKPLIEERFPYEIDMLNVGLLKTDADNERLSLDMKFELDQLPLDSYVTIYLYEAEHSWEKVAELALELDALLEKNQIFVHQYSVVLSLPPTETTKYESLGVYYFPKSSLQEENLADYMKQYYEKWEADSMKEKEKELGIQS